MPMASELPKKISENDSPTTAVMPQRRRPCGACSRDDPQPKLRFTTRMEAPAKRGSSNGWALPCLVRGGAVVLEDVPLEPLEADRLQEAGRHDPVGVDVLAGDGHDGAFEADDAGDRAVGADTRSL